MSRRMKRCLTTMNPSTADILAAVNKVNADSVVILPNNKNIIMAAQACVEVSEKPCAVVATTSVPQAFSPSARKLEHLPSITACGLA